MSVTSTNIACAFARNCAKLQTKTHYMTLGLRFSHACTAGVEYIASTKTCKFTLLQYQFVTSLRSKLDLKLLLG